MAETEITERNGRQNSSTSQTKCMFSLFILNVYLMILSFAELIWRASAIGEKMTMEQGKTEECLEKNAVRASLQNIRNHLGMSWG